VCGVLGVPHGVSGLALSSRGDGPGRRGKGTGSSWEASWGLLEARGRQVEWGRSLGAGRRCAGSWPEVCWELAGGVLGARLGAGTWYVVHGTWYVVHGTWYVVHGTWYVVHGTWYVVHGTWCMVHGAWRMVHDTWYLVLGTWHNYCIGLGGARSRASAAGE
jgi:hypothetical protein